MLMATESWLSSFYSNLHLYSKVYFFNSLIAKQRVVNLTKQSIATSIAEVLQGYSPPDALREGLKLIARETTWCCRPSIVNAGDSGIKFTRSSIQSIVNTARVQLSLSFNTSRPLTRSECVKSILYKGDSGSSDNDGGSDDKG